MGRPPLFGSAPGHQNIRTGLYANTKNLQTYQYEGTSSSPMVLVAYVSSFLAATCSNLSSRSVANTSNSQIRRLSNTSSRQLVPLRHPGNQSRQGHAFSIPPCSDQSATAKGWIYSLNCLLRVPTRRNILYREPPCAAIWHLLRQEIFI